MKKSVMSAGGSSAIKGASRWLAAFAAVGPLPPRRPRASAAAHAPETRAKASSLFLIGLLPVVASVERALFGPCRGAVHTNRSSPVGELRDRNGSARRRQHVRLQGGVVA